MQPLLRPPCTLLEIFEKLHITRNPIVKSCVHATSVTYRLARCNARKSNEHATAYSLGENVLMYTNRQNLLQNGSVNKIICPSPHVKLILRNCKLKRLYFHEKKKYFFKYKWFKSFHVFPACAQIRKQLISIKQDKF